MLSLYTAVDITIGFIAMLPMLLLFHVAAIKRCRQLLTKTAMFHIIMAYVFCFVLAAILTITGVPSIRSIRIDATVNLVPFADITTNFIQYVLNVALFIPVGFFLPLLWRKFAAKSFTISAGLMFSTLIETAQLFSHRATDIDDVLMNTAGTAAGYLMYVLLRKWFPKITALSDETNGSFQKWEVWLCFVFAWLAMFFVQPFISGWFWRLLYRN